MTFPRETGLSAQVAKELLMQHGPNEITQQHSKKVLRMIWEQVSSPLTIILVVTAVVSIIISKLSGQGGDTIDGVLILSIVVFSGIAGFVQNYRAEKTIESLRKMSAPHATVRRDNVEQLIPVREVVPNDIIILQAGDVVPADAQLLSSHHVSVNESVLTGESQQIDKQEKDEVFKGTTVMVGRAEAVVTSTGMHTTFGRIASGLQHITEGPTSFQIEIKRLSSSILWFIGFVIAIIFVSAFVRFGLFESFLFSVSLAVAAIPEGLPAIMAVVLAMGAQSMVHKKALVRKLNAVESMGDVEVICTDKTGTITQNNMNVVSVYTQNTEYDTTRGVVKKINTHIPHCAVLCSNAHKIPQGDDMIYEGSQTEIALLQFGNKYVSDELLTNYTRIDEIPFTHERKFNTALYEEINTSDRYIYTLGAPEVILKQCSFILDENGKKRPLRKTDRNTIIAQYEQYANKALRVLGSAYIPTRGNVCKTEGLIWLGLMAMADPPRKGVKKAVKDVYRAGIRIIMLTGDNAKTAEAIAREVGIKSTGTIIGDELEEMDDAELYRVLGSRCNIFARISPFHKLRILKMLKKSYRCVAMTGDGVNDALALKQADVGIAMGVRGTEVAKDASDIILLDDRFSTIRDAIREGRRSLDNVKKFINYLAVSNIAEIGVLFVSTVFMSFSEPILAPVHILWINLITDGLPAIALGVDPAVPGLMRRKPRGTNPLIDKKLRLQILVIGIKKILILLATFWVLLPLGLPIARTALFTGFILYEFVRIATIRKQERTSLFINKWLIVALVFSLLLQLIVVYSPLNVIFSVTSLPLVAWGVLLIGIVIGYIGAIGITKVIDARFQD